MGLPRLILAANDFSLAGEYALDHALAIAEPIGARLCVLHAYDLPPEAYVCRPALHLPRSAIRDRVEGAARRALAASLARRKSDRVRLEPLLVEGDPVVAALDAVTWGGAELLVVGANARTRIGRLLLGSVAEALVRLSPVPVLVVPAERRRTSPTSRQ